MQPAPLLDAGLLLIPHKCKRTHQHPAASSCVISARSRCSHSSTCGNLGRSSGACAQQAWISAHRPSGQRAGRGSRSHCGSNTGDKALQRTVLAAAWKGGKREGAVVHYLTCTPTAKIICMGPSSRQGCCCAMHSHRSTCNRPQARLLNGLCLLSILAVHACDALRTAKAKTSTQSLAGKPSNCSGGIYAGVPACMRVLLAASDTSLSLEMPKSHTCGVEVEHDGTQARNEYTMNCLHRGMCTGPHSHMERAGPGSNHSCTATLHCMQAHLGVAVQI
jgi:hypothetical protein